MNVVPALGAGAPSRVAPDRGYLRRRRRPRRSPGPAVVARRQHQLQQGQERRRRIGVELLGRQVLGDVGTELHVVLNIKQLQEVVAEARVGERVAQHHQRHQARRQCLRERRQRCWRRVLLIGVVVVVGHGNQKGGGKYALKASKPLLK